MNSSQLPFRSIRIVTAGLAVLAFPAIAAAHAGAGHTHGFASGLSHPVLGLDHICAMVAVGLWAAQRGGRAVWFVPGTFVGVMALAAMLGATGVSVPLVEPGIAVSVLILGLLITAAVRMPVALSAGLVGLFALFHGYAHGAEIPASGSGLMYGAGFVFATAALHLAGIGFARALARARRERLVRVAGGAIAVCGVALCLA